MSSASRRVVSKKITPPADDAGHAAAYGRGMPAPTRTELGASHRLQAPTGAACGLAYVALAVVGNDILSSAGHAPAANASPAAIGAFVASHPGTTRIWIG